MIYNISDEPLYGFKRKAEPTLIYIGFKESIGKFVNLQFIVNYYKVDDAPITIIPPKIVTLRADETTWVDSNGNIVPQEDPAAVMTEYEFFMAMMNVPIVISDIVEAKVAWADSLGRFN